MSNTPINTLTVSDYQALVDGIPKYCPNAVFIVAGQTFTAAQAVTFITSVLNAVSAVSAAKTGWVDARIAEETLLATDGPIVRGMRDNIATMFSNNTTTLAAFNLTPKKPRQPLSVEARAAATAKARATRIARGTESKKKKAEVSGNVTGVTITPLTNPSASSPSAAGSSATASAPAASTSGVPLVPTAIGH